MRKSYFFWSVDCTSDVTEGIILENYPLYDSFWEWFSVHCNCQFQISSEKAIVVPRNNLFRAQCKIQKKRGLYLRQILSIMDRNGDNRAVAIMSLFSVRKQEYFDRIKPICVYFTSWINQGSWFIISTEKLDLWMLHNKEIKRNWEKGELLKHN